METTKSRQFTHLLLVLLLFLAPLKTLFASDQNIHSIDMLNSAGQTMEVHLDHSGSMADMIDHNTHNLEQNCENQCANCVFCTAVMFSYDFSNENLVAVYTHAYTYARINNIPDVDIRPPK